MHIKKYDITDSKQQKIRHYPFSEKYPTHSCDLSHDMFGLLHSIHAIRFSVGSMCGKAKKSLPLTSTVGSEVKRE
jgi:hypothetical protein